MTKVAKCGHPRCGVEVPEKVARDLGWLVRDVPFEPRVLCPQHSWMGCYTLHVEDVKTLDDANLIARAFHEGLGRLGKNNRFGL